VAPGRDRIEVILASRRFTWTLVAVMVLALALLVALVYLSVTIPDPTKSQSSAIDTITKALFACVGAVVGLLGGKVT